MENDVDDLYTSCLLDVKNPWNNEVSTLKLFPSERNENILNNKNKVCYNSYDIILFFQLISFDFLFLYFSQFTSLPSKEYITNFSHNLLCLPVFPFPTYPAQLPSLPVPSKLCVAHSPPSLSHSLPCFLHLLCNLSHPLFCLSHSLANLSHPLPRVSHSLPYQSHVPGHSLLYLLYFSFQVH